MVDDKNQDEKIGVINSPSNIKRVYFSPFGIIKKWEKEQGETSKQHIEHIYHIEKG